MASLRNRSNPEIVVSISDGSIKILGKESGGFQVVEAWHAHNFEPWIAVWDVHQPSLIWTGTSPA